MYFKLSGRICETWLVVVLPGQGPSIEAPMTLWAGWFLVVGASCALKAVLQQLWTLLLNALSNIPTPSMTIKMPPDIALCPLGAKLSPVENTALGSEAGGRILLFISPILNSILYFLFLCLVLPWTCTIFIRKKPSYYFFNKRKKVSRFTSELIYNRRGKWTILLIKILQEAVLPFWWI